MARYIGPTCKLARREGVDLGLKSPARGLESKCKLNQVPGQHGASRRQRLSDYALQLREKQKVRRTYGILEKQFRNYVAWAKGQKGVTGEALLTLLERRFDNLVYRAGFASSRDQARQMITHGHFEVNGRATNVPSVLLREGDTVAVKEGRRARVKSILDTNKKREAPSWLERNIDAMKFQTIAPPNLEETGYTIAANLIVEFYSR